MKKLISLILAVLALSAFGIGVSLAVDNTATPAMTNLQFAELLAQRLNIQLAPGTENLSEDAYFAALTLALAARNITIFANTNKADTVTVSRVVDTIYMVVGGAPQVTDTAQKAAYLVENGFLPSVPQDLSAPATTQGVQAILSTPALSTVIAETYTPPNAGEPPAAGEEPPASPI